MKLEKLPPLKCLHLFLSYIIIYRQFLGLGIPPPPSAATKIFSSSHVHRGSCACSGEARGKSRGRLMGTKREYAFLVRNPLQQWKQTDFLNDLTCCSVEQLRKSRGIGGPQRRPDSLERGCPVHSYKIGDGISILDLFGPRSQKEREGFLMTVLHWTKRCSDRFWLSSQLKGELGAQETKILGGSGLG